jgi:acetoin utilization protein AcuC
MLLVFGPRSTDYDFGPGHPLTPRRFGPGIDLLRAVGAEPGLAPEPPADALLGWCHERRYVDVVKRFSADPFGFAAAGIGDGGDCPPFADMHEASAAVAGGSVRAMEAILRGEVEHAFHPGGGLHHAMAARASGFCIYNDPALAIARARQDGLRVLYLDLDVHHGDGVQALHWSDPGVLTVSIHESGRSLFPGTGDADELGHGLAAGTAVNLPLPAGTDADTWSHVLRMLLPELAAAFGPDVIVSQHGADSHAWDPLAHLDVTTNAMGEMARLIDALAHQYAGGRWLATGGGGYDAYRVVPRAWALTWLAGAHRDVPESTPEAWRSRWADEAARYGQAPLPLTFDDDLGALLGRSSASGVDGGRAGIDERTVAQSTLVRRAVVPRLVREATDRGWWDPPRPTAADAAVAASNVSSAPDVVGHVSILDSVDRAVWSALRLAARVIAPADPAIAHAIVDAALADGALVTAAVDDMTVVGLVLTDRPGGELLALGVAPSHRRRGLARDLLAVEAARPDGSAASAEISMAERDVADPLDRSVRASIARQSLERAGFSAVLPDADLVAIDPMLLAFERRLSRRGRRSAPDRTSLDRD